jgi:hypothetical protein
VSVFVRFVLAPLVLVAFVWLGVQISRQSKAAPRSSFGVVVQRMAKAIHVYVGLAAIGFVVVLVIGLIRLAF